MQTSPFKFLPIIFVILALGAALAFAGKREAAKNQLNNLLEQAKTKLSLRLPEPTPFIPVRQFENEALKPSMTPTASVTPTPSLTLSTIPTPTPTAKKDKKTEAQTIANTKGGTETICTPVYGMANSCAEHAVVDTGLETSLFPTLAMSSYFAGLIAFVKAKKRA